MSRVPFNQIVGGVQVDYLDLILSPYKPSAAPKNVMQLLRMLPFELQRIAEGINGAQRGAMQVAYSEPDKPQVGMLRYVRAPWNPFGDGYEGPAFYDHAAAWRKVTFT